MPRNLDFFCEKNRDSFLIHTYGHYVIEGFV